MEFLIPFFRFIHFVGFALLLGGTLASVVLVYKEKPSLKTASIASVCMHMLAAPGLTLLLLTGLLHSAVLYWENFKGAGYMHVKVTLVVLVFVLMIVDISTLKKISKRAPEPSTMAAMFKRRQAISTTICILTLIIMWLISFRPF